MAKPRIAIALLAGIPLLFGASCSDPEDGGPTNRRADQHGLSIHATVSSGAVPLVVGFSPTATSVPKTAKYHWQFGDGASSEEESPQHTYIDPAIHEVKLTLEDGGVTLDTATLPIEAMPPLATSIEISPEPKRMLVGADPKLPLSGSFSVVIDDRIAQFSSIPERVKAALDAHAGVTSVVRTTTEAFAQFGDLEKQPQGTVFLVLKDEPHTGGPLSSSGEKIADYDTLIGAKGFNQGYVIFLRKGQLFVRAASAEGLFYGAVTLTSILEQVTDALPNLALIDYPDLERRIYYPLGHENPNNLGDPAPGLDLIERMARAKLNGVHLSSGSMAQNFDNMFGPYIKAAKARFIRPILGTTTPVDQLCAVEGFRVVDEPFNVVSDIAVPVRPNDMGFTNLDFSSGTVGGVPTGWTTADVSLDNGQWKLANASALGGTMSAVLSRDKSNTDSRPMLSQEQPIVAGTWVLAEFRVRTENTSGSGGYQLLLGARDATGAVVSYRQEEITGANDGAWQSIPVHLSPRPDADRLIIWIRPASQLRGTIYVDEVKLTRMNRAVSNVLLGNGHEFRVADSGTGALYKENVDYVLTRTGPEPSTVAQIQTLSSSMKLQRVPSGAMPSNASLRVSYDYLYRQDKSTPRNMSPFVDCGYNAVRDYYKGLSEKMQADGLDLSDVDIFVGQDEIRGFNQDARALAANVDNARAFSVHLNRLILAVRASFSAARTYVWADMLDGHDNGGIDDYQAWWGGKFGKTMPAAFTLPPNVTLIPWNYDVKDKLKVMRESVRTFNRWGIRAAGGAGGNLENIQYWSAMLHDTPNEFYGHATFGATLTKEEAIAAFGAYSWRNYEGPVAAIAEGHQFELCNSVDDDGDGSVDEDYDLMTDADHCGACGHACDFAHGFGQCIGGKCSLAGCVPGFRDLDGAPANGCEAHD